MNNVVIFVMLVMIVLFNLDKFVLMLDVFLLCLFLLSDVYVLKIE